MANGDPSNGTMLASGKQFTVDFEAMDDTALTAFEADKEAVAAGTSEGYSDAAVLGTIARTGIQCKFVSAADDGSGNARVTFEATEPFADDCTSITVNLPSGLLDDGTIQSTANATLAISNTSNTSDYPTIQGGIVGVVDSSGDLLMNYSEVSGTITVEALAFQAPEPSTLSGQPAACVKLEVVEELILSGGGLSGDVADGDAVTSAGDYTATVVGAHTSGSTAIRVRNVSGTPSGTLTFGGVDTGTYASGGTGLSETVTAMTRSAFVPSLFYNRAVTLGFIDEAPTTGSGVFSADFDLSTLDDGNLYVYAELYPTVGDADSIRTVDNAPLDRQLGWTLYKDASITVSTKFVNSTGTATLGTNLSDDCGNGWTVTGDVSGATAWLRGDHSSGASTLRLSKKNATEFNSDENLTITAQDGGSNRTAVLSGTPTWNGDDTAAGTELAPYRSLPRALQDAAGGSTGTRYEIKLWGGANPAHYGCARNNASNNALSTWCVVSRADGVSRDSVYVWGGTGTAAQSDNRIRRLKFYDLNFIFDTLTGDNGRGTALWLDLCDRHALNGRRTTDTASTSWTITEWHDPNGGGLYITRCNFGDWDNTGVEQATVVRDIVIDKIDADFIKILSSMLTMEGICTDNDSPESAAHEDNIQPLATSDINAVVYNWIGVPITRQCFLTDDVQGIAVVNVLSPSTASGDTGFSQIGNSSGDHNVQNLFIVHFTFPNARLEFRDGGVGDVDANVFLAYSVFKGMNFLANGHNNLHNHMLDLASTQVQVTGEVSGNPWADGVGPDEGDPDDGTQRDYRVSTESAGDNLCDRIPAGKRYTPFDLFGSAVPNDGTGAIGALQAEAASAAAGATSVLSSSIGSTRRAYYGRYWRRR